MHIVVFYLFENGLLVALEIWLGILRLSSTVSCICLFIYVYPF